MTREIKFRAWDGNRIIEDVTVFSDEEIVYVDEYNHRTYPVKSIMQYTGLKDKNGKEIYEGDIVDVNTFEQGSIRRVVIYDAPGFLLAKDTEDKISVFAFSTPNIHETIIGNIYENPELLNK